MHLDARGHPLHTRALAVTLRQRDDGRLDLESYILDLRKRGFVPVGADLQSSGIIHHMRIGGVVEPESLQLQSVAADQPSIAFEASALTRGESCRDPVARVGALAGVRFDADYAKNLNNVMGGALGCSHLLSLARFVGPTVAWAIGHERELHATTPQRRTGERVFRRDLIIDGAQITARGLHVALQLIDLHFAPAAAVARPMARFAAELEARLLLEVDLPGFTLARATAARRYRRLENLDSATWEDLDELMGGLLGMPVLHGATAELRRRFPARPDIQPIGDALLMVAPALIQCTAALSEAWPSQAKGSTSLVGMTGIPDSCYMWRRGGALHERRAEDDPLPRM